MASIEIRPAVASDCPTIMQFVRDLAIYEKALHELEATEDDLHRALFGPNPKAFGLVCNVDGKPAGFAVYFFNFSTWLGKYGLFLEDLFVSAEYRGCGAGKALLKHLARLAVEKGCGRFEWNVLDWNTPSIEFYESFGALPQDEWVGYRLTGDALTHFADDD